MEYQFNLPGFEGRQLKLVIGTFKKRPKILVDGQPAPLSPYGNVELRRADGTQALAQVVVQPGGRRQSFWWTGSRWSWSA